MNSSQKLITGFYFLINLYNLPICLLFLNYLNFFVHNVSYFLINFRTLFTKFNIEFYLIKMLFNHFHIDYYNFETIMY